METEETTTLCETCKMPMERIIEKCPTILGGLLPHAHERTECDKCLYDGFERSLYTVKRPFKVPDPRRRKDGRPPEEFIQYVKRVRRHEH